MAGNGRPKTGSNAARDEVTSKDPCDRRFSADLVSVKLAAAKKLEAGSILGVQLRKEGAFETAVCVTSSDEVVGTFAGIRGLDQLLACLRTGYHYTATVKSVSGAAVHVSVKPA